MMGFQYHVFLECDIVIFKVIGSVSRKDGSMRKETVINSALVLFLVQSVMAQNTLPCDAEGWTIFTPSADSRIIYVSQENGDDAAAEVYSPDDAAIGTDPFAPSGDVLSYATISEAFQQARDGFPDWVLFKRGEVWTGVSFAPKNGRTDGEPSLVAAYGTDGAAPHRGT